MADKLNHTALASQTLFNVKGLLALVTGGGSGLGLMMAKGLARNGAAKVYIAGRRLEILQEAAAVIGPQAVPIQCDVTSKESIQGMVELIKKDTGYLNLLICNAGTLGPQVATPTPETTLKNWAAQNLSHDVQSYTDTFTINVTAVWYTAMACLTLLDAGNRKGNLQQSSQIITSIAGFNKKAPSGWAYGQSKAAAVLATKQLAVTLPQWNIRANGIAPGLFPSAMSVNTVKPYKNDANDSLAIPQNIVPLQRMGEEQEIAGTILYLASQAGAYTNRAILVVDGGRLGNFPSTL
ncbi:3-oxoacyl-[acyl-carrier protein] reductase [Fusarium sp. Ph1]|nr:3-oxoacyl-[acyl-carrier protein] reductase [Fusarium sp. Ph1]